MATPTIKIDQGVLSPGVAGTSRQDLATGSVVTLTDPANGAGAYTWELVVPPGSSATLTNGNTATATFTPDVVGTYLAFLTFDADTSFTLDSDGSKVSGQGGAGVKHRQGVRPLGVGETFQFHALNGFAEDFNANFSYIDAIQQIAGAAEGTFFYADANGDVALLSPGTSGQVLQSGGPAAIPSWLTPSPGVTDHGLLTGLSDDDHSQYLLIDGSRAMTGVLQLTAGTELLPSLNLGDPDTGPWSPAPDTLAISTGGTEAVRWNASQQTVTIDGNAATPAVTGSLLNSGFYFLSGQPSISHNGAHRLKVTTQATFSVDAVCDTDKLRDLGNATRRWGTSYSESFDAEYSAIGTAETAGFLAINDTAATIGAQQYSPMLVLEGQGWDTNLNATAETKWAQQARPVQETTAAPSSELAFKASIAGGAYADVMTLTSGGQIIAAGDILPDVDSANDIGTSLLRWAEVWADYLGSTSIETGNGLVSAPALQLGSGVYGLYNRTGTEVSVTTNSGLAAEWSAANVLTNYGNIEASADSTHDIGTTSARWANLFVDDITVTADITATGDVDAAGGMRRTLHRQQKFPDSASTTYTMTSDGSASGYFGWFVPPRAGSVVEISTWSSGDVASGTIDFWVQKSTDGGDTFTDLWGSSGSPILSMSTTNPETNAAAQAKDTSTFNAGDVLRIQMRSGATFPSFTFFAAIGIEC